MVPFDGKVTVGEPQFIDEGMSVDEAVALVESKVMELKEKEEIK